MNKKTGIPVCPNCESEKVTGCKGGTALKPNLGINWICTDCLYEW